MPVSQDFFCWDSLISELKYQLLDTQLFQVITPQRCYFLSNPNESAIVNRMLFLSSISSQVDLRERNLGHSLFYPGLKEKQLWKTMSRGQFLKRVLTYDTD